ncbi:DEAD/DEAH box helicase [Methanomethylovorans sp.]|uniref:DEAD/DEAH box helicase n=1 Tax=Methanomethylovorans sp. TaxID=2758717 RepID=UPI00345EA288
MIKGWQYSTHHNSPCKIIEEQNLWGNIVYRIWLPNQDTVVRVPKSALRPLSFELHPEIETNRIAYIAAAAKIAEVLEGTTGTSDGPVLLAPMESNVIPLPHQIHVLFRAISGDRIRYLLADEVGLGKTIEAGLIMRELKLRGLVRRTLVVAPKGLTTQWIAEMQTHFNEKFQLVLGDDINVLQRFANGTGDHHNSLWSGFDQVVVSLDSVKPMDKRRGWSPERIAEYNRSRFEDLVTACWDLVIVDEAHRLGGSTDTVARYKLGQGLAEAAPYVLLLSATPHQGKSDAFYRLLNLLDNLAFPDMESVSRERVAPYVIRTEKRKAIDAKGKPLFKARQTHMVPVRWESRHRDQQLLYEAVTDYIREGYNQALKENKQHLGFLMLLMQRLVVSSTRAICTTLERRLEVLKDKQLSISSCMYDMNNDNVEDLYDMDGQELLDELLKPTVQALQNESRQVEILLEAARRCEQAGPDAKAESLFQWIYKLQGDENEPDLKILIFTEFVPTQQMLKEFLEARGISVVILNGSMDIEKRKKAQDTFLKSARVLVSTDAGGEGLNLQFCHVVINYDIPWNPMRLEQRIGRVDRIGQIKKVQALNFILEESVEFRVREILEKKLSVILNEFGVDKTSDVLDSAQAGLIFEDVFVSAFMDPNTMETTLDHNLALLREEIREIRETAVIYGISDEPDIHTAEHLRSHPLPHWVERMTVGYLNSHGGKATRKRSWWELVWPDGTIHQKIVFSIRESERHSDTTLFTLENNQIRGLALNIPQIVIGQPIPCVSIKELQSNLSGLWGLFEVRLQAGLQSNSQIIRIPLVRKRYASVFLTDKGKLFLPTARHIWDAMQTTELKLAQYLDQVESKNAYGKLFDAVKNIGQELFNAMQQEHNSFLEKEEARGINAFRSRQKTIERLGLPEVRQFRFSKLEKEEKEWRSELNLAKQVFPDIRPLILMKIIQDE